jgi:membrane protein DedA with SNARE-associated domain
MGFIPILIITSVGSAMGFILMYYVGKVFGEKIIRSGKIKFIHQDDIEKADRWFNKYGYYVITANRFLPGTRSVISFFSGVHELNVWKTFLYAAISAFAWNVLIIFFGMQVGQNIEIIDYYLSTYSNIIIAISAVVIGYLAFRVHKRHKEQSQKEN